MANKKKASVEFLEFLAEISHPATGLVQSNILALKLEMSEAELLDRWAQRGQISLAEFMSEIVGVLDGIQDQTLNFNRTVRNFRYEPLELFGARTADQVVSNGEGGRLVKAIRVGALSLR